MSGSTRKKKKKSVRSGKLRIADHWNAISIIANSQANPLKAVAEFVENSIDAQAKQIVIVRGKKKDRFGRPGIPMEYYRRRRPSQ